MSLADGVYLIQSGVNILTLPIAAWDNLSLYDIMRAVIFIGIIGWFAARMIKGKSHSEIGVSQETYNDGTDHEDMAYSEYATNGSEKGVTEDWDY